MGFSQFEETVPLVWNAPFNNGSGTTVEIDTTGAQGHIRIDQIYGTSTDTVDRFVNITLAGGSSNTKVGSFKVPAGAGYAGVATAEFFSSEATQFPNGLVIPFNTALNFSMEVAVTAGKLVDVTVFGGQV